MTDDPDTPEDGHWEINLAAIGSHTPGVSQLALPDADINYGWGDHIQLKIDTPWLFQSPGNGGTRSGLGASELGVKWRFIDQKTSGFSMSTYPQVSLNPDAASARRGLIAAGQQWFLPVEVSTEVEGFGVDAELGRSGGSQTPDAWAAGLILAHDCGGPVQCLFEVHDNIVTGDTQTLLNLGWHATLSESLGLLAAIGRDIGPRRDDRQDLLFYLGLQVLW